jgi:hypothetical protein
MISEPSAGLRKWDTNRAMAQQQIVLRGSKRASWADLPVAWADKV